MDAYFSWISIGFLYLDVGCQSNPRSNTDPQASGRWVSEPVVIDTDCLNVVRALKSRVENRAHLLDASEGGEISCK